MYKMHPEDLEALETATGAEFVALLAMHINDRMEVRDTPSGDLNRLTGERGVRLWQAYLGVAVGRALCNEATAEEFKETLTALWEVIERQINEENE